MEHEVELAAAKGAEVAHVATDVVDLGPAPARERAHGRELPRRDVEERRVRAELGKEDGVPAAPAGEREHALAVERRVAEAAARDLVEETPFAGAVSRRRPLRPRVGDAGAREAVPHALVVRRDLVDGDASRHAPIV